METNKSIFEETRLEYLPKMIVALKRPTQDFDLTNEIAYRFRRATNIALEMIGEKDEKSVVKHNKVDLANKVVSDILELMLKQPPRGYIPTVKEVWEFQRLLDKIRE